MSPKTHSQAYKVAEEAQLLAEEKWLVEALYMIRNQRNSLQIERLHLEAMKAKLKLKNIQSNTAMTQAPAANVPTTDNANSSPKPVENPSTSKVQEFQTPLGAEALCNEEELNLMVSEPVLSKFSTIEDHEVEEEEDEDCDNVYVDMNMLMNVLPAEGFATFNSES